MGYDSGYITGGAAALAATRLDAALYWHLTGHFPPLPADLIPAAKRAIRHANRGAWDRCVRLPNNKLAPVAKLVDALSLHPFVKWEARTVTRNESSSRAPALRGLREVRLTAAQLEGMLARLREQLNKPLTFADRLKTERRIERLVAIMPEDRHGGRPVAENTAS
jgi:hypothetical protein